MELPNEPLEDILWDQFGENFRSVRAWLVSEVHSRKCIRFLEEMKICNLFPKVKYFFFFNETFKWLHAFASIRILFHFKFPNLYFCFPQMLILKFLELSIGIVESIILSTIACKPMDFLFNHLVQRLFILTNSSWTIIRTPAVHDGQNNIKNEGTSPDANILLFRKTPTYSLPFHRNKWRSEVAIIF